jgi:hypothetical protein
LYWYSKRKEAVERGSTMQKYNYQWQTIEQILANQNTKVEFSGRYATTLAEITDNAPETIYQEAHETWQRLKTKFNQEAPTYEPESYTSKLGSIGTVEDREVRRSAWWDECKGENAKEENYHQITRLIEVLHCGEQLETGIIRFGS